MKKKLRKVTAVLLAILLIVSLFSISSVSNAAVIDSEMVGGSITISSSDVINYFVGRVGDYYPSGKCLAFVANCWSNLGATFSSACCAYNYGNSHIQSTSIDNIPIGADVFFGNCGGGPCSNCGASYYGHIGVYVGNGEFVHATGGSVQKSSLSSWRNKYRGWGFHSYVTVKDEPIPNFPGEEDTSWDVPVWAYADCYSYTYSSSGVREIDHHIDEGDYCYVKKVFKNLFALVEYPIGGQYREAYTSATAFTLYSKPKPVLEGFPGEEQKGWAVPTWVYANCDSYTINAFGQQEDYLIKAGDFCYIDKVFKYDNWLYAHVRYPYGGGYREAYTSAGAFTLYTIDTSFPGEEQPSWATPTWVYANCDTYTINAAGIQENYLIKAGDFCYIDKVYKHDNLLYAHVQYPYNGEYREAYTSAYAFTLYTKDSSFPGEEQLSWAMPTWVYANCDAYTINAAGIQEDYLIKAGDFCYIDKVFKYDNWLYAHVQYPYGGGYREAYTSAGAFTLYTKDTSFPGEEQPSWATPTWVYANCDSYTINAAGKQEDYMIKAGDFCYIDKVYKYDNLLYVHVQYPYNGEYREAYTSAYAFTLYTKDSSFPGEEQTSWAVPTWVYANCHSYTINAAGKQEDYLIRAGDFCYIDKVYKYDNLLYAHVQYPYNGEYREAYTSAYAFTLYTKNSSFPGEEQRSWDVPTWVNANCDSYTINSAGIQEDYLIKAGDFCYIDKVYKYDNLLYAHVQYPYNGEYREAYTSAYAFTLHTKPIFKVGDTNLDENIDVRDVTAIQRHISELELFTEEQLAVADTDGDGEINIADATHLQMYLAEYDVQLG